MINPLNTCIPLASRLTQSKLTACIRNQSQVQKLIVGILSFIIHPKNKIKWKLVLKICQGVFHLARLCF